MENESRLSKAEFWEWFERFETIPEESILNLSPSEKAFFHFIKTLSPDNAIKVCELFPRMFRRYCRLWESLNNK